MTEQQLREAILRLADDGKVQCMKLLELAEKTQTPPRRLGSLCDEMKIRIAACQLGCFK